MPLWGAFVRCFCEVVPLCGARIQFVSAAVFLSLPLSSTNTLPLCNTLVQSPCVVPLRDGLLRWPFAVAYYSGLHCPCAILLCDALLRCSCAMFWCGVLMRCSCAVFFCDAYITAVRLVQ